MKNLVTFFSVVVLSVGCASARGATGDTYASHGVVAVAPGGGEVSHAIAIELEQRGYTVVDGPATSRLMSKLQVSELDIAMPQGLSSFAKEGVDAVLFVTTSGSAQDLQRATVRLTRTRDAQLVAGVNWQNSMGVDKLSGASTGLRKSVTEAAGEIANELVARAQ